MQIKVNGVTISVENAPVTSGNLAYDPKVIATCESMSLDIMRSEESMDTTLRVLKDLADKKLLKGQESFAETAKNVGQSVVGFLEKVYNTISQFIQKQVSAMLLKKFEKKVAENKDKVNYWYMSQSAFDSYYELAVTKGEKEFNALIDAARANSKADYQSKQDIQATLTKIRDVVLNLSHANLMSDGVAGNKTVKDGNIQLDNSKVVGYIADAKKNFTGTMGSMKELQSALNKHIQLLRKDGNANAQDARIVGKFSNLCFKTVFGYYKLLASLTPVNNTAQTANA